MFLFQEFKAGYCFPSVPMQNIKQRNYDMKVRQEDTHVVNGSDDNICTKFIEGKHSTLTPGIFSLSCPHGVVYGYTCAITSLMAECTTFSDLE